MNAMVTPETLRRLALPLILAAVAPAVTRDASAETVLSIYLGKAVTRDSDVHLDAPGGTHLTLHDVSWADRSFESPVYLGLRVSWWPAARARVGMGFDITHSKIYLSPGDSGRVSGMRAGQTVEGIEPIANSVERFNNSHGLNLVTANALYRWPPDSAVSRPSPAAPRRLEPYAGGGIGFAWSHIEAVVGGVETSEYENAGSVAQALGGVGFARHRRFSGFAEYKISYTRERADLAGGERISFDALTQHFVVGVALTFR